MRQIFYISYCDLNKIGMTRQFKILWRTLPCAYIMRSNENLKSLNFPPFNTNDICLCLG
ncbi:unnamed protein product, partial [Tenebrio molitor]